MKISFFYCFINPRDTCRMMALGLFTVHEDDWLDIGLGLLLVEVGIHIEYGKFSED